MVDFLQRVGFRTIDNFYQIVGYFYKLHNSPASLAANGQARQMGPVNNTIFEREVVAWLVTGSSHGPCTEAMFRCIS
jgi:hypothetical protein